MQNNHIDAFLLHFGVGVAKYQKNKGGLPPTVLRVMTFTASLLASNSQLKIGCQKCLSFT